VARGQATVTTKGGSSVVKLKGRDRHGHHDRYVELARERTDRIFVILAEFGTERSPDYPDQDTDPRTPGPTVFDGPLHNAIPRPDRRVDNSTNWQADYSRAHYQNLYFGTGKNTESLKTYYETQSSGRYSVDGTVQDWVKVRYNEARYGRSDGYPCGGHICTNSWALITDALNQWVADQKAAGRSDAQIKATLSSYDQWDRYDHDGDGNYNEPDGYLDHFQIVHAGGDQADRDPYQGEDAIWSHRSFAYYNLDGAAGPAGNLDGGTQIGDTGFWVGDYTMQPENGGLSVFAHEYGHDLGLPDDYDTDPNGGGSPTEWWTLMSQSRLSARGEPIGSRPGDFGAWQKYQLGWLNYAQIKAGDKKTLELGPQEYNTKKPQAVLVTLPKKQVVTTLPTPTSGSYEWWSGAGNDLETTLTRSVAVPAGSSALTFQANYNIEDCDADPCDYAFVEVDDGSGFVALPGSIADADEGNGIDGVSDGWVPASFDLSAYAGKTVQLRFRYLTDPATQGTDPNQPSGLFVDDIAVTGAFTDDVETLQPAWTADGFTRTVGSYTTAYDNYYLAGYRSYVSYDRYLATGPYNFGWETAKPKLVEHFGYQPGLLVSYWDTSQSDNNVSVHPGEGLNLYVDSHPAAIVRSDAAHTPWRTRIQMYDAPFSLRRADSFWLHFEGKPSYVRGQAAQPVFDDSRDYLDPLQPEHGVKVPNTGTRMQVLTQQGTSMKVRFTGPRP
jgi:immune inhibitor A